MYDNVKIIFDCTNENIIDLICEETPEYTFIREEPILFLEMTRLTVQIITNTKQITYERECLYHFFRRKIDNFLDGYDLCVQKNEDNYIINNSGNKLLFIQGLNEYFNLHINGDDLLE